MSVLNQSPSNPRTSTEKTVTPTIAIHEHIKRDRERYLPQGEKVIDYRNFANGKTGIVLTDDMKEILTGLTTHEACENIAHRVIAEARDRLQFEAWVCEKDTRVQEFLRDLWVYESIEERYSNVHYDTLLDGNHALAVNWDNTKKRVRIYREPWWDGFEGLFIAYNALDEPVYAVKEWRIETYDEGGHPNGTATRRIVYFDDRWERWKSIDGSNWEPIILPEDKGVWPIPWQKMDGSPLGIPYVHFKNSGKGQRVYGASELSGGVLGLCLHVQDLHYVMAGGARLNGFPIITIAGIEVEKDSDGNDLNPPKAYPGGILHTPNSDTEFGTIEPGNPQGLISLRREKLQAIATGTQTPFHIIFGGDYPSGEALLRSEQPAVGKAETQRPVLEKAWASVGHKAVEIQNRFGTEKPLNEDVKTARITARFASTERRDPLSRSIIVSNLGDRISDQKAHELMGWTAEESETIMEQKQEEATNNAENQAILFSRGVVPRPALPGGGNRNGNPETRDNAGTEPPTQNADRSRREKRTQNRAGDAGEGK